MEVVKRLYNGEKIVEKSLIATHAIEALAANETLQKTFLIAPVNTLKAATPVLVQRLDRNNEFYYIVPVMSGSNTTSLVSMDALYGNYNESAHAAPNTSLTFQTLTDAEIMKVLGPTVEIASERKVLNVIAGGAHVYPNLVWMPCQESLSPYWPFHMVLIGNHKIYVRVDGKVFTSLTTDIKGA
jgi:hypothetical protein